MPEPIIAARMAQRVTSRSSPSSVKPRLGESARDTPRGRRGVGGLLGGLAMLVCLARNAAGVPVAVEKAKTRAANGRSVDYYNN